MLPRVVTCLLQNTCILRAMLRARVEPRLRGSRLLFGTAGFDLLLVGKRSMGATDMFGKLYRLFCCFSVGDAANSGQGTSTDSGSQTTGSQNQGPAMASSSGANSCWCGFLNGSTKHTGTGTGTKNGVDTAGSIAVPLREMENLDQF